jgi:hypothetical protein
LLLRVFEKVYIALKWKIQMLWHATECRTTAHDLDPYASPPATPLICRNYFKEAGSRLAIQERPIFVWIRLYVTAVRRLFLWILPWARWIQYHTYNNFFLFLRFCLIVSSNLGLGFPSGISPSVILLQFYQLVSTYSCYTWRQSCIYYRRFKALIPLNDVSRIYVKLFLWRFETRTCILHFLKMPWIGRWWGRWGSFDDSF